MSHIFPLKVFSLVSALKEIDYFSRFQHMQVQSPNDGMLRCAFLSPEVRFAVQEMTDLPDFRMRMAVPDTRDFLMTCEKSQFELYAIDNTPVIKPIKFTQLGNHLACAIEAELFRELLEAKGLNIPLL